MKTSTVPNRVRTAAALAVVAAAVTAAVLASFLVDRPAPAPTVGLIPAACASINPVEFPCALPSMGVRW